jgi:hypothetical protein
MKANLIFLLTTVLLASACSPSPAAIETAIAQTQIAQAPADVVTPQPLTSDSPTMTPTTAPTMTPTPLPIEEGEFGTETCTDFIRELTDIVLRWDDAVELASNTQRIALTDRIADLQTIRREARQLEEPLCSERLAAKPKLVEMMDDGIDWLTEFMAERGTSVERAFFRISSDLFSDALISLGQEKNDPPHRVHYFVTGETGLTLEYTDENGEVIRVPENTAGQMGRIGTDKMPAVFSVLVPERDDIAFTVRLFNATYPDRQMHCFIFSNGQIIREASGVREVICSFVP